MRRSSAVNIQLIGIGLAKNLKEVVLNKNSGFFKIIYLFINNYKLWIYAKLTKHEPKKSRIYEKSSHSPYEKNMNPLKLNKNHKLYRFICKYTYRPP